MSEMSNNEDYLLKEVQLPSDCIDELLVDSYPQPEPKPEMKPVIHIYVYKLLNILINNNKINIKIILINNKHVSLYLSNMLLVSLNKNKNISTLRTKNLIIYLLLIIHL